MRLWQLLLLESLNSLLNAARESSFCGNANVNPEWKINVKGISDLQPSISGRKVNEVK